MSSRLVVNSIRHTGASVDGITLDNAGNFSTGGTITDGKGNVRKIIINSQSGAYTLVAADAGKAIYIFQLVVLLFQMRFFLLVMQ